ncbi:MAG: aminotransferase class V-fold PLP-dependent enzyme, partial [Proteobacteria bacterium]|nr:aminotransferase class V-fold PLP-dependent enzyme [Pseudomonadota bacterium]
MRKELPATGTDWDSLQAEMIELGKGDADWRRARTAVYVFNAGEDVLRVAKEAYALYSSENALGPAAFPSLKRMESEVLDMGLSLLNAPEGAVGNMTSGGTESILMAVKACRNQARAAGRDTAGGEILVPHSAHPAFDKAAWYLDLRVVRVPVSEALTADVPAMADAINERTLMLVGSAPCFPYGLIDPIGALSDLALERDVWLHVDACVGGYFTPFARMNGIPAPEFDFSIPGVRSISADLHKYGYAAKGASTVFHRSEEQRAHQIFDFSDWPAGGMTTPTAAGTRPGGAIASAWAVMHYLGIEGYRAKAKLVTDTRTKIRAAVAEIEGFETYGKPQLGLLAYGSQDVDPHAVWG